MRLRELIDASPAPMWRRDSDRRLVECNRAYAFAVDATPQTALAQNLELAATGLRKTLSPAMGTAELALDAVPFRAAFGGAVCLLPGSDCQFSGKDHNAAIDQHVARTGDVLEILHTPGIDFADRHLTQPSCRGASQRKQLHRARACSRAMRGVSKHGGASIEPSSSFETRARAFASAVRSRCTLPRMRTTATLRIL